jgi:DNA repair protein RecN (Recombination protein N)
VLQELRVENLLLIERAELRLAPGLNVLTGETGAGKTVLAHALDLLLGGRARQGIVRPGASEAYVEGTFDLPAALRGRLAERISPDSDELVLARRVAGDGRTRAYLNGRSLALAELRELGAELLAFYGQHEHRKLTLAAVQLQILDSLAPDAHRERLRACGDAFVRVRELERLQAELRELGVQRERELDLLEFELAEIDAAAPEPGEYEQLRAARERLRQHDALQGAAAAGAQALTGPTEGPDGGRGAAELLATATATLQQLAGVDGALDELAGRLGELAIEANEVGVELRDYCERSAEEGLLAFAGAGEPLTLDALEQRLAAIERLMRKHGGSVEQVIAHATRCRARREELAGAEVALAANEQELGAAREQLEAHVLALREQRRASAGPFAEAVREQLGALAMGDAEFEVDFLEREPGPGGGDGVDFLIAPNPGVPAAPLREVASGGELSRVMLAIMSVATAAEETATLVFDEVDAGIGGQTARAVGERLRELGERRQVVCITHLPQIASLGARHFSIVKDTGAEPTLTTVVQLGERDVIGELVRMLGADSDDAGARKHARELRRAA